MQSTFLQFGISIHAPLAGCDFSAHAQISTIVNFNPRTPCGVRQTGCPVTPAPETISIHAPLAGCDSAAAFSAAAFSISIHAPLAGCDQKYVKLGGNGEVFQSTHPLRGATAKLPKYSRKICAKATKFLQSQTKSGVAACWAKGKQPLFPALRGANLPGKTGTLPVRIR